MGRNYYCDFCARSFVDILGIRKKHLNSAQHKRLRKMYYDSFKDPATLLAEEAEKAPCRRFFQTGHCDFGDHCKYSHTNRALLNEQRKNDVKQPRQIDMDKIHSWISSWQQKHEKEGGIRQKFEYRLPAGFPPAQQLPPSLQPPLPGFQVTSEPEWG